MVYWALIAYMLLVAGLMLIWMPLGIAAGIVGTLVFYWAVMRVFRG